MISYAKLTKAAYSQITPVTDRIYYITDTGEQYLNGMLYTPDTHDYMCFTALESNSTVAMATYNNTSTTHKPTVEYSTDKVTWHTLITNDTPSSAVTLANAGDKMWVRGNNANFSKDNTDYTKFNLTGSIKVSGNIMSLLDKTCKSITLPASTSSNSVYVFASLFYNNSALVDASELVLPASTVNYGSYYSMFRSCSNLVKAPKLPATTLGIYAYGGMFRDCTSLAEAPELPATTVTANSYNALFRGCTSLKHIKYPLTDFIPCTYWLATVPSTGVFECSSALDTSTRGSNTVPADWTIVRYDAPQSDWNEAVSTEASFIKNKPDISECLCLTALEANSTVSIDKVGTPYTINLQYRLSPDGAWNTYTWSGSTGYTITLANAGDSVWFRGNNATFASNTYNYHKFVMTGSIGASGSVMSLLGTSMMFGSFLRLFYGCTSLKNAPMLPATALYSTNAYAYMFQGCTSLVEAPELPATTLSVTCYYGMFYQCTGLTKVPDVLPATTLAASCYASMFQNCTSLKVAPKLHATKLDKNCCLSMFGYCTSLEVAPELPATTPISGCYGFMFQNCTSLKYLKVGFSDWGTSSTSNWLYDASTTCTFVCPSGLDTTTTQDVSHVPSTYTVIHGSNYPDGSTTVVDASTSSTYMVCPSEGQTPVVTVSSALTLSAIDTASTEIAYAEIVIDLASGATVTAGSNLTLVDTFTENKRNVCVVRWSEGTAKLYKVLEEDLDDSSSSN